MARNRVTHSVWGAAGVSLLVTAAAMAAGEQRARDTALPREANHQTAHTLVGSSVADDTVQRDERPTSTVPTEHRATRGQKRQLPETHLRQQSRTTKHLLGTYSKSAQRRQAFGAPCLIDGPANCHLPDQAGHGSEGTLAANATAFAVADDILSEVNGVITEVCWWGLYFDFGGGTDCSMPDPGDMFEITYFFDAGNIPGSIKAGPFAVVPVKAPTGQMTGGISEWEFTATHPPVLVNAGQCCWIQIRNTVGTPGCSWLWSTAPPSDNLSFQDADDDGYGPVDQNDYDLAWCVNVANSPDSCLGACTKSCEPGSTPEGEPATNCQDDGTDDNYNAGCNSDPPSWFDIDCETSGTSGVICGTGGNFTNTTQSCTDDDDCPDGETCVGGFCTGGPFPIRDTDWYRFTLTADANVTWSVNTEFEGTIGIIDIQNGACTDAAFIVAEGVIGCIADQVSACLPPGTYAAFVAATTGGSTPCGSIYNAELTCVPKPPGTCPLIGDQCNIIDPLQCQLPDQMGHGSGGITGATSDVNPAAGFRVADNFKPLGPGVITEVCWYGFYIDFVAGGVDCGPGTAPDDFTITYYLSDPSGCRPGPLHAGPFNVGAVTKGTTGNLNGGNVEFSYTATHAPVPVVPTECYWLEIVNNTTGDCLWLWETAPPGDSLSAQDGDGNGSYDPGEESDYDLAWCLDVFVTPVGCETSGACCVDATGTCNDDVSCTECLFVTEGRFGGAGSTCATIDPPCGTFGCCLPDGSCIDTTAIDCANQGGQFHPTVQCEPGGELLCNVFDDCDSDNGPGDPAGNAFASQYSPGDFYAETIDNFIFKGDTENQCRIDEITWWVSVFNDGPAAGGCNAGTCPDSSDCDTKDPNACGGVPADCAPLNPACTKTPADYSNIRVTIYNSDGPDPGPVDIVENNACNVPIPEGPVADEGADCASVADCAAGEACIDNDGDGDTECAAVCDIVVAGLGGVVEDLDVDLRITHTWQGDLVVSLEHVDSGTLRQLMRQPGNTDFHAGGFGADGYSADNFGVFGGAPLILDDQSCGPEINLYDGDDAGIDDYIGPAVSGGGGAASAVLGAFAGLARDATWRIYVTDEYGTLDSGTVDGFSLHFGPQNKGPTGFPEHIEDPVPCTTDQECIDIGCGDMATCNASDECLDNLGESCFFLVPTGDHVGLTKYDLILTPGDYSFIPYVKDGQPVEDAYEIVLDLSKFNVVLEKNKKNWLAIAPELPFDGFYQTAWMESQNRDGNPAQQIFEVLGLFPWAPVDDCVDVAFRIDGTKVGDTPCIDFTDCADTNGDGITDDNCLWWECVAGVCVSTAVPFADIGGPFGACPVDGTADGNDRFHALNCFSNMNPNPPPANYLCEPSPPSALNVDAAGSFGECCPDGVCDGNDAFAALNAFGGITPCACPADGGLSFVCPCPVPTDPPGNPVLCPPPGPSPEGSGTWPTIVDTSPVSLRTAKRSVHAGDLIEVEVYLDRAVSDLRGYQLHLGVTGGRSGGFELVDQFVAERPDHVFNGLPFWVAFNRHTNQMVAGLDSPGVATRDSGYLATFVYRVSREASGRFAVDLLHDDRNRQNRTFLFATPASGKIAIEDAPTLPISVRSTATR